MRGPKVFGTLVLVCLCMMTQMTTMADSIDNCEFKIVESIPEGVEFPDGPEHESTHKTWLELLADAKKSVDIASFYWTLLNSDVPPGDNSSWMGEEVFEAILNTGLHTDVKIRIAQNKPSSINPANDTALLEKVGAATVKTLDFDALLGAGVLHTKFWIVDDTHVYIGSANMDYRSLSQVKELGAVVRNCPNLAVDLKKVFEVYWSLGGANSVPPSWPKELATKYNEVNPLEANFNGSATQVFVSSSPPPFSPIGRADDLQSIVDAINAADKFVYIAVMDYIPQIIYGGKDKGKLWLPIDEALRKAAVERKVEVKLLMSEWKSTRKAGKAFVSSLGELGRAFNVRTKKFVVPPLPNNRTVPYSRVNHNKYMVTDKVAYIGTSNWSGDYFINTAGVGLNIYNEEAIKQLKAIFVRDFNSTYSHYIYEKV